MRLARITLDVYAVLGPGETAAGLKDDDVRLILGTVLEQPMRDERHRLDSAGGFGLGKDRWCGVYTVDREEVFANAITPNTIRDPLSGEVTA